jgi:hypothetical protein
MRITDMMIVLVISATFIGGFILIASDMERYYPGMNVTDRYDSAAYMGVVDEQRAVSSGTVDFIAGSSELSGEGNTTSGNWFDRVFRTAWSGIKRFVGVAGNIESVTGQVQDDLESTGFQIPGFIIVAFLAVVVILVARSLFEAVFQRAV